MTTSHKLGIVNVQMRISDVVLETKVLVSRRLKDKNTSLGLGLET